MFVCVCVCACASVHLHAWYRMSHCRWAGLLPERHSAILLLRLSLSYPPSSHNINFADEPLMSHSIFFSELVKSKTQRSRINRAKTSKRIHLGPELGLCISDPFLNSYACF